MSTTTMSTTVMGVQDLPRMQGWVRQLQVLDYGDEFELTLGRVTDWIDRMLSRSDRDRLGGTIPILLREAAVDLFNLTVSRSNLIPIEPRLQIRSASCALMDLSSSPAQDRSSADAEIWLKIHFFTASLFHEAKKFDKAEFYFKIACGNGILSPSRAGTAPILPSLHQLAFNVFSLRSENFWELGLIEEAHSMASNAARYVDSLTGFSYHLKLYNKGAKLYQNGDHSRSAQWLKLSLKVIESAESHPQGPSKRARALRVLSVVLKAQEKYAEALNAISHCLGMFPDDIEALYLQTELLIRDQKFEDASKSLVDTIQHSGCSQKMGAALCQLFKDANELERSMKGYDELLVRFPESIRLGLSRLSCLLAMDNTDEAGSLADRILSEHISARHEMSKDDLEQFRNILNNIALHFFEIRLFRPCSDWIARNERLAAYIQDDSKSTYLCRCALSMAEFEQGNTNEALRCALTAETHMPSSSSLAKLLACRCYVRFNDPHAAKTKLEGALCSEDFDRTYLMLILNESIDAGLNDCVSICIEQLVSSDVENNEKLPLLQCALDLSYRETVSHDESANDEPIDGHVNRCLGHLRSAARFLQETQIQVLSKTCSYENIQKDAAWFGKIAWNLGLISAKHEALSLCADCFHSSTTFFQMLSGYGDPETNSRIILSLCMSASGAVQQCSTGERVAALDPSSSQEQKLCDFAAKRLREFHVFIRSIPNEPLLSNICPIMHILDLQIKLMQNDPNIETHIRNSTSVPGWKSSIFSEVASICLQPAYLRRDAALIALQLQLAAELGQRLSQQAINIERVSKIIRQLISLANTIDSQVQFFDQVAGLIVNQAGSSTTTLYPKLEAQWLVSRSWNNGVICYRAAQWDTAEMWMARSIQLANLFSEACCPNKQDMVRSHSFVLSRIQQYRNSTSPAR